MSLIRYGGRLREADSKLAWLYRVTDRCCFAQFERQKKHEPVADTDTASDSVDTGDQVEDRNTVVRLLAQLDDKERQVAVMAYVDELSKEEIGRRLGWSRQTIHKKLKSIQAKAKSFKEHHHV